MATNVPIHPKYGRGARKQIVRDAAGPSYLPEPKGASYNIWYGKNMGGERVVDRSPAKTRCRPSVDSGYTRADMATSADPAPICLYFARGACTAGHECIFFHRIPNSDDEARLSLIKDIFGRDRHATDRDDMGGVGTFNRENTTLFVGGLIRPNMPKTSTATSQPMPFKRKGPLSAASARFAARRALESDGAWQAVEASAHKHFSEWGQIKYIKMLPEKACMFVCYVMRSSAEFAKEAMANQAMDFDEILNVRWAHEDPNPRAVVEKEFTNLQRVYRAVADKHGLTPDQVIPELEDGNAPKRQHIETTQDQPSSSSSAAAPVYASQDPAYLNTRFASSMYAPLTTGAVPSTIAHQEYVYPETTQQYVAGTGYDADTYAAEQQKQQWIAYAHHMLATGQADAETVASWYAYMGYEWDGGGPGFDLATTITPDDGVTRESALAALAAYGADDDDEDGAEQEKKKQDTTSTAPDSNIPSTNTSTSTSTSTSPSPSTSTSTSISTSSTTSSTSTSPATTDTSTPTSTSTSSADPS